MLLLLSSCSKEDTPDNTDPPIKSTTGAITEKGVDFSNPELKCTKCIIEFLPATRLSAEESYATMTLQFNDNVEIVFKGIADVRDETEALKVYRLLKNCYKSDWNDGSITVNLKDGDKVVTSEKFDPPTNADWWHMASDDSYFTIDLDLKGTKYTYKGLFKYTFPEEEDKPTTSTGAITDKGVDFNNSKLKCTEYKFNTISTTEFPPLSEGQRYTNMTLQFNDDVEVVFTGMLDDAVDTEGSKVYCVLKNCMTWGRVTVNMKSGDKVISSEKFDYPSNKFEYEVVNGDFYFTIDLDLKGKLQYKGQIKYTFPPIKSATGAITEKGVDFGNSSLKCTKYTIEKLYSLSEYESVATMKLQFNDNVEVIFRGIVDINDKTEAQKVSRLLKNCYKLEWNNGGIMINLKDGDKIIHSEKHHLPTKSWWSVANDNSYFTIDLTLIGKKYNHKGQVKYIF